MPAVANDVSVATAGETRFFAKANLRPLLFCAIAVFGAITYGYEGVYYTSVLAMDRFKRDFGTEVSPGTFEFASDLRSLTTSMIQAGQFVGALCAGPIGDWAGRRGAFFAAIFLVILGAVLQMIVAGSVPLLTVGRVVLGAGVGVIANCTPLYLSEISTVGIRGVTVGSWQLLLSIGQVLGAVVGNSTRDRPDTGSYRIPMGINILWGVLLFCGQFIIPESPRWLVNKNREEKAIRSLQRINKDQPDPDEVVNAQLDSFNKAKEEELAIGKAKWSDLLTNPVERRKLAIVCGVLSSQQINGIQFVFSYTTVFFEDSGVQNAFTSTIAVTCVQVAGVLLSFLLVNRFGRRPLLLITSVPMFLVLLAAGALGAINRNSTQNQALVALICLFVLFFNLAWGPLAWVVASECAAGRNRQKIMSIGSACFFLWAFIVAFTLPYFYDEEYAGLGPMVGFIYAGGALIGIVFVWFVVPETRGRTLEEIAEMLNARVPTRKWTTYVSAVEKSGVYPEPSTYSPTAGSAHSDEAEMEQADKKGATGVTADADK